MEVTKPKEKYCHWCGEELTPGMVYCSTKNIPLTARQTPFVDYCAHKGKSKIEDTVFNRVKEFLLAHFFGAGVVLSIVEATVIAVTARPGYIERVTVSPAEASAVAARQQEAQSGGAEALPGGTAAAQENAAVVTGWPETALYKENVVFAKLMDFDGDGTEDLILAEKKPGSDGISFAFCPGSRLYEENYLSLSGGSSHRMNGLSIVRRSNGMCYFRSDESQSVENGSYSFVDLHSFDGWITLVEHVRESDETEYLYEYGGYGPDTQGPGWQATRADLDAVLAQFELVETLPFLMNTTDFSSVRSTVDEVKQELALRRDSA